MKTARPPISGQCYGPEFFSALAAAIAELQQHAITAVEYPLQRAGNTLLLNLPQTVQVRNNSGGDLDQFDILGIDGPLFDPTDAPAMFKGDVVLKGVAPALPDHAGRFVILLAPLAAGQVGPARAAGVCQVQISVSEPAHQFADVSAGQTTRLASAVGGSAKILWQPLAPMVGDPPAAATPPYTVWALVLLGAAPFRLKWAKITEADFSLPPDGIYVCDAAWHELNADFGAPVECDRFGSTPETPVPITLVFYDRGRDKTVRHAFHTGDVVGYLVADNDLAINNPVNLVVYSDMVAWVPN